MKYPSKLHEMNEKKTVAKKLDKMKSKMKAGKSKKAC